MKAIARMALTPGMELAEDVVNSHNEIIVRAHTQVDNAVISRLERYQIMVVSIMEEIDYATTHFEKIRLSEGFSRFEKDYQRIFPEYKERMNALVENGTPVDPETLLGYYHLLADPVPRGKLLLDYLYNMVPSEDELTHAHCFNSALIAGVFADWLAMKEYQKNMLIQCAFFYDIGKLKISNELLWKPGKLTDIEFEEIKTHTLLGYNIVKNQDNLDPSVIKSILMHHERCDGRGYPSKLKMQQIDFYARHIAIIDAYEAMTSPRSYRQSLLPLQIVEHFEKNGMLQYDYNILRPIMKRIADTQIGLSVKLSDDSVWEIFLINERHFSRPVLKRNLPDSDKIDFLDLDRRKDLTVTAIY